MNKHHDGSSNEAINIWRQVYCILFPIIAVIIYLCCYCRLGIKIWTSKNFSDTLTSMITFVSIIISFFGVLLTLLITAKENSKLIKHFLDSADKEDFAASIRKLIMNGLLTVIFSAILYMNDIMVEKIIVIFMCCEIYVLIKFTALTYRFTNILLMLFIKDFNGNEGTKLPEDRKKALDEKIQNGI